MESDATAVPPEQELTDALLALSWPLPRTVGDAQSALDRLEGVTSVLGRLEQESVGTEAWWAGQVDALCTQSGFVLEWWLPVLRDPDLDWTLNHQAHLTADLATLASAGARLLDQLEPSAVQDAPLGRRGGARRDWGPAAVPPFPPPGGGPQAPGTRSRPQPPAEVFGDFPVAPPDPQRAGQPPARVPAQMQAQGQSRTQQQAQAQQAQAQIRAQMQALAQQAQERAQAQVEAQAQAQARARAQAQQAHQGQAPQAPAQAPTPPPSVSSPPPQPPHQEHGQEPQPQQQSYPPSPAQLPSPPQSDGSAEADTVPSVPTAQSFAPADSEAPSEAPADLPPTLFLPDDAQSLDLLPDDAPSVPPAAQDFAPPGDPSGAESASSGPSAEDLEAPSFPPLPGADAFAASEVFDGSFETDESASAGPSRAAEPNAAARHRRPAYDFDDPASAAPPPAVFPQQQGPAPASAPPGPSAGRRRSRVRRRARPDRVRPPRRIRHRAPARTRRPGTQAGAAGFGTAPPPHRGAMPPPGRGHGPGRPPNAPGYPPPGRPPGFAPDEDPYRADPYREDDDEPGRVVPTGLRRHQRRLLVQTGLILAAIGGLCWWAVYSLADGGSHPAAAGSTHPDASHSAAPPATGAAGLTVPGSSPAASSAAPSASSAPPTAATSVPDTTTATSVQATLLGGSGAVPQIVVLVNVHTAGTGTISVTAAYYGQGGGGQVAAESQTWALSGKTAYQFSVPIANSPYCGTTFHLTLRAGGRSSSAETAPGC